MSRKRILVVDDDLQVLKLLACILRDLGHCVLQAKDGVEALRLAEREPVDILVTDLGMPQDGLELIRRLRADPCLRHIPIIATTGGAKGNEAALAGADTVLRKPFGWKDLALALTTVAQAR